MSVVLLFSADKKRKLLIEYININELQYIRKMPQGVYEPHYWEKKMLLKNEKYLYFRNPQNTEYFFF